MKISVITPTFNSEQFVQDTIESIEVQTYKNYEHIIIDGESTDGTLSIVKKFNNITFISEKDSGQSNALNKGFKLASGDILAWQNADDLYVPEAFETVRNFFISNPKVDIVYGDYQLIDSGGKWICDVYPIEWDAWMFMHGRFVPMQPTVFWRRRVFEKVGFLNEDLHYCMDVDFFSRALVNGFIFKKIGKTLGKFRVHSESKTQNLLNERKVNAEYKNVLARSFNYKPLDSFFFECLTLRSRIAKRMKVSFLKNA
jgi:glycosyltransferase involved in cell wall biosynthesis